MRRLKRFGNIAIIVVGLISPLGVLAVNGAAFLMQHLSTFRLTIAVMSAVGCLVLNTLVARQALRFARQNAPAIYREYLRWIVVLAILAVLLSAAVSTYLTYEGMANPRHLPSLLAVLGSFVALAMPFALTYGERIVLRRLLALRARHTPRQQPTPPPAHV
ncbi:MAG: hypothetical protein WAM30_01830 [Candidatus Dormiibacterota bacterium]